MALFGLSEKVISLTAEVRLRVVREGYEGGCDDEKSDTSLCDGFKYS